MERARIWYPAILGDPELLRARHVTHRFPRHTHEGYAIGVIEEGALGFRYRGEEVVAPAGAINLVVPDEPHTGEPAGGASWTYRMFYLPPELLAGAHRSLAGESAGQPQFRPGVVGDAALAGRLVALHRDLEDGAAPRLEVESRLAGLLQDFIRRHATRRVDPGPVRLPGGLVRAREYLRAHHADEVSLEQLAAIAGQSPWHLARRFTAAYGVPPHAYQLQLRVADASRRIAGGEGIADIAVATGFADQSHLTRHFKRLTGMTPGRYRKNVQE